MHRQKAWRVRVKRTIEDWIDIQKEWYEIPNFPNYRISKDGRIKRIEIYIPHGNYPEYLCRLKERILKPHFTKRVGFSTMLTDASGEQKTIIVARLLLTVFDRPPKNGELARHLDDNKRNQSLANLAWGSEKDNAADAIRNNRYIRGSCHSESKLTEEQVLEIKSLYIRRDHNFGIYGLARKYKVGVDAIESIIRGKTWKHVIPLLAIDKPSNYNGEV